MGRRGRDPRAQATRPARLPDVEPELRPAPPRVVPAVTRAGRRLPPEHLALVQAWHAIKGWIVAVEKVADHEGPDYHIEVAWPDPRAPGQVRIEKRVIGYDAYHWAVGAPEHFAWFHRRIVAGQPVTVLVEPRGKAWSLYGQCEPFIDRGAGPVFAAD